MDSPITSTSRVEAGPNEPYVRLPLRAYVPAGALITLAIVVCYLPIVLRGLCLAEGEGVVFYLPLRELVAAHWRAGEWPLWNPYTFAGLPLLADCQAGAFYPPNLLFLLLPPAAAMNAVMLLTHIITAWGMLLLIREYGVRPWAAAVGAIAVTFSGFMVAHMGHVTIVNAACWLPWLCWVTHRYAATRRSVWIALGAVLWATQIMAGHPQMVVYGAMTVGMMVATLACSGGWGRPLRGRLVGGTSATLVLGVLLAAVQWVPTAELSRNTGRGLRASESVYGHYHLPLNHTGLLWFPQLFGAQSDNPFSPEYWGGWNFVETTGYVGLLPWMLLPAAWISRRWRPFGRVWILLAFAHLLLAWGPQTPVGRALFYAPIYNGFRAPGRHLLGLALALGVAAAIGLEALATDTPKHRRRGAAWGAGLILALMVAVATAMTLGHDAMLRYLRGYGVAETLLPDRTVLLNSPVAMLLPFALAIVSAAVLWYWASRQSRRSIATLLAVLLIDVGIAACLCAWAWRHDGPYRMAHAPPDVLALLASDNGNEPSSRFVFFGPWGDEYALNPQGNIRERLASLQGYGPFQLRRYADLAGGMTYGGEIDDDQFLATNHRGLDLLAGRYVLVRHDADVAALRAQSDRFVPRRTAGDAHVFENLRATPRAWIVHDALALQNADQVLQAIITGALPDGRRFDPARQALFERADVAEMRSEELPTESNPEPVASVAGVKWNTYSSSALSLQVATQRPGWLVLAEPFYPGWKASVNGLATPVLRANHALRAVRLTPGTHHVELRFQPASLRMGLSVSAVSALLVIAVGFTSEFKRRSRK